MTTNKSKIFERDGYQLKVEQHGIGPKLLIIGSVDYYKRVIPTRLHEHFTCLYLDHRGFAQTVNDKQNDIITLDIIIAYIKDLNLVKFELSESSNFLRRA